MDRWLLSNLWNGSKVMNKMKLDSFQEHRLCFTFFVCWSGVSKTHFHSSRVNSEKLVLSAVLHLRTWIMREEKNNEKCKPKSPQLPLSWVGVGGIGEEGRDCRCFMLSELRYCSTQWFWQSPVSSIHCISLLACSHASSVQMHSEWEIWNETSCFTATPGDDHKPLAFTQAHLIDVLKLTI